MSGLLWFVIAVAIVYAPLCHDSDTAVARVLLTNGCCGGERRRGGIVVVVDDEQLCSFCRCFRCV